MSHLALPFLYFLRHTDLAAFMLNHSYSHCCAPFWPMLLHEWIMSVVPHSSSVSSLKYISHLYTPILHDSPSDVENNPEKRKKKSPGGPWFVCFPIPTPSSLIPPGYGAEPQAMRLPTPSCLVSMEQNAFQFSRPFWLTKGRAPPSSHPSLSSPPSAPAQSFQSHHRWTHGLNYLSNPVCLLPYHLGVVFLNNSLRTLLLYGKACFGPVPHEYNGSKEGSHGRKQKGWWMS